MMLTTDRQNPLKSHSLLSLQLALGLFFGWMLSFAISGPLLMMLAESVSYHGFSPTLAFLIFHAAGLAFLGLTIKNTFRLPAFILPAGLICTLSYIIFWFSDIDFWLALIALMAFTSAFLTLAWCRSYGQTISITGRVQFMAIVIMIAALENFLINIAASRFDISIAYLLNALPLVASIPFFLSIKKEPACNVLAIFTGGIIGVRINTRVGNSYIDATMIAITSILITIILVPFLNHLIEKHLVKKVARDMAEESKFDQSLIITATDNNTGLNTFAEAEIGKASVVPAPLLSLSGRTIGSLPNTGTLTAREAEILSKVLEGLANKEIALELNISENTLKTHIRHLYGKLGISNKRDLFLRYIGNQ